ncbi:cell division protein ZapE [Granulibacter bethesdensis]|uniref:ATPase n=1 Tax=Granulibacter bethesdensis (strain ATCC BAA-1260 / CGDNIH1) TaxID=391165 RepID=Q0BQD2_GRABC|nr:cell division protein ZapE [Granulibacter bethesdensis]ABI62970.1 ATPase [Granulibacter bethesdensis CGDNIH1]APH52840.1 ATPase [Granulibacter bethesdensis]APH65528.1 ATPase [Granulibacter bethesdensis]
MTGDDLSLGPLPAYRARAEAGIITADQGQLAVAEKLQALWQALQGYEPSPAPARKGWLSRLLGAQAQGAEPPRGVYMVGDVGRGKSMLMDLFHGAVGLTRKKRVHFHRFMQDAHARVHRWRMDNPGGADPIPPLADSIAAESILLCFDEFQVNDIADAMLLGRLFEALFARGVVIVATSNTEPDNLFAGKPGRDAFLPFIALIRQKLDLVTLNGARDWRRDRLRVTPRWHVPADARADAALDRAFAELSDGVPAGPVSLSVSGRTLTIPLAANGVARADFDHLCNTNLGPGDYLAIATHFEVLVLDGVPCLSPDNHDAARRFITLIDALYDHRVKLIASAAAQPDALYQAGEGAEAFRRTASRLEEMQSEDYVETACIP